MINPRISAVWIITKAIAPFSGTPRVQEVHTKAEVIHLTPGLLGLGGPSWRLECWVLALHWHMILCTVTCSKLPGTHTQGL